MGVEAGRLALRARRTPRSTACGSPPPTRPTSTRRTPRPSTPRCGSTRRAGHRPGGAVRSGVGALRSALESNGTTLVVSADLRSGLPDQRRRGRPAATAPPPSLVGERRRRSSPSTSAGPRSPRSSSTAGAPRATATPARGRSASASPSTPARRAGLGRRPQGRRRSRPSDVATGRHPQPERPGRRRMAKALGGVQVARRPRLDGRQHRHRPRRPAAGLAARAGRARPGHRPGVAGRRRRRAALPDHRRDAGCAVPSGRRPGRGRASTCPTASSWPGGARSSWSRPAGPSPAGRRPPSPHRTEDWKFGFVGSRDRETGALHLPPARVSFTNAHQDDMEAAPMADVEATIATFTIDRMAYSPSPPIVFAIVDFDGGGRLPVRADRLLRGRRRTSATGSR